jgi:lipopolysaccharide transport system permease protein
MNREPPEPLSRHGAEMHAYEARTQAMWDVRGWREMFAELIESRELTWRLFRRDFSARFRQNVGGILWAFVSPVILVGGVMLLRSSGMLNVGDLDAPYPVYAVLGLTVWLMFAGVVGGCTGALAGAGDLVRRINFPREALVLSAAGHVLVDVLIRLVLFAFVLAWFRVVPCWTSIFLPLVVLPILLLGLALGFILSALNAVVRDIGNAASIVLTYLVFLVPAMYPCPESGLLATLMKYNPLTPPVTASLDIVLRGTITEPLPFIAVSLGSLAAVLLAWRVFHMLEPLVAERV